MAANIIDGAIAQARQLNEAAEEILHRAVDNDDLLSSERQVLRIVFGSDDEIEKQLKRVESVRRFQEAAGTTTDRETLAKKIEAAKRKAEKECPKLREQIAELESQCNKLETAHVAPERQLKTANDAVSSLRTMTLLPTEVGTSYNDALRRARKQFRVPLNDDKSRAEKLRFLINLPVPDQSQGLPGDGTTFGQFAEMLMREFPFGHPLRPMVFGGRVSVAITRWNAHVASLVDELAELDQRIPVLQQAWEDAEREVETIRDFYLV